MAPPQTLPLPRGDSRSSATPGWSLSSPKAQHLMFGSLLVAMIVYLLHNTISIQFEYDNDLQLSQQQQQPHNWDMSSGQWSNGQAPPLVDSSALYPGSSLQEGRPLSSGGEQPPQQHTQQQVSMEDTNDVEGHDNEEEEDRGVGNESDILAPSYPNIHEQQPSHNLQDANRLNFPRLYDMIIFNGELDMLEIRLHELENVVDVFVIIESEESFQRQKKPLHFRLNERLPRFQRYSDRILHIVVPPMSNQDFARAQQVGGSGWEAETYLRNKGLLMALDIFRPTVGDWIMHMDVDEIPRAQVLEQIKANHVDTLVRGAGGGKLTSFLQLECAFYYYSYEFRRTKPWIGPALARFEEASSDNVNVYADDADKLDANGRLILDKPFWDDWSNLGYRLRMRVRNGDDVPVVKNACWHCSWCLATTTEYYSKASQHSHVDHSKPAFMNERWIVQHVREGKDLFDRVEQEYDNVINNDDLPEFVNDNRDRFAYMLDRKGKANAGFTDIDEDTVDY